MGIYIILFRYARGIYYILDIYKRIYRERGSEDI